MSLIASRRMPALPTALLSCAVLASVALAAPASAGIASMGEKAVSVRPVPAVSIERGKADTAHVTVTVQPGFHVQANPASDEYLIPTTLTVTASRGITAGKLLYPKGKEHKLQGSEDKMSTYAGTFEIAVPLKAARTATFGPRKLRAALRFQACDDKACFAPTSIPVEIEVQVVKAGEAASRSPF
jgi:hypothetical protein